MHKRIGVSCLCALTAIAATLTQHSLSAWELSEQDFKRLHAQLQPQPDESWRTIPWKIGLLDAQHLAAAEKKPIFIWAMDGHPLGCT